MATSGSGASSGFLAQVLDQFGIEWTSIAVFSTLVFSAFNLGNYISTAAWLVGTVVAFSVIFVFRRQITASFGRVALIAIPVVIVLLVVGYVIASQRTTAPLFLEHHKVVSSFYLSAAVMLPMAVLLLSYRQQELSLGAPLPAQLQRAVQVGVLAAPVYRREIDYRVSLLSVDEKNVMVSVEIGYTAVNRTPTRQRVMVALTPIRRQTEYLSAQVRGRNYDVQDPQYRTEFGLQIPVDLEPNEQAGVRLSAKVAYNLYDQDMFCSWVPATSLELHLVNPFKQVIWMAVESLLPAKVTSDVAADGSESYRAMEGVLPHQGFRVLWGMKSA